MIKLKIRDVLIHPMYTTIFWDDGSETQVECLDDVFDETAGVLWAIAKKALGSTKLVQDAIDMGRNNLNNNKEYLKKLDKK